MRLAILLLLATIIVAEPVIHSHPLLPALAGSDAAGLKASSVCALCAVGAGHIVLSLPVVTVLVVSSPVVEVTIGSESADRTAPGTSRAPPAA